MFHLHGQAQPAEAVVVVRAFLKKYPESEIREVGEMEGFVQRVQTVEHDENKSKEEWSELCDRCDTRIVKVLMKMLEQAVLTITTPIVKVLLKRMERAGLTGPLAQIFSIKKN